MINEHNYNRLNLSGFAYGDTVIIKLKLTPPGFEYYGIIEQITLQDVKIRGKGLSYIINGDMVLELYCFKISSIEDIQLYTYEGAEAARHRAKHIIDKKTDIILKGIICHCT